MKYNLKIEDIIKKYPFMYEADGEIYHIGHLVFMKCNNQIALRYFNNYQSLIDRMDRDKFINGQLDETETEDLVYYFRKIKAYSEICPLEERNINSNKETINFISALNKESKNSLLVQLENYVYAFQYYSRKF